MSDMETDRLRSTIEERLLERGAKDGQINADEFRAACSVYRQVVQTEPALVNALMLHFMARQAATTAVNVGSPPADWRIHSREVMAQFRKHQAVVLALLELEAPAPLSSVESRLWGMWNSQMCVGEALDLPLPPHQWYEGAPRSSTWRRVPVFQGRVANDDEEDAYLPVQPLYRLAQMAAHIAYRTGITPQEAVAFLVADEDVILPWIRATVDERPLTGTDGVTLVIGTTEVRPEEVRAAYEQVRADRDKASKVPEGMLIAVINPFEPAYSRRPIPEKTAALIAFVDKYMRDRGLHKMTAEDWDACNKEFGEKYSGTYEAYGKGETMRTAYARAKKRAKGATT